MQRGYLNVVVSPDILNDADTNVSSLDESVTNEGGQIQLVCIATGVPQPTVSDCRVAIYTQPMFEISIACFFFLIFFSNFTWFTFKCLVRVEKKKTIACGLVLLSWVCAVCTLMSKMEYNIERDEKKNGPTATLGHIVNYLKLNSDLYLKLGIYGAPVALHAKQCGRTHNSIQSNNVIFIIVFFIRSFLLHFQRQSITIRLLHQFCISLLLAFFFYVFFCMHENWRSR